MRKTSSNHVPVILVLVGFSFVFWDLLAENTPKPTPPEEDFSSHTPGTPFRLFGGKIDEGQKAFEALNCVQCHKVMGCRVADPVGKRRIELTLAGEVRFVKRYEDILLAITNPRHVINEQYRAILTKAELDGSIEPLMPDLTDHMTARQLVDLVAFLDSAYSKSQEGYISPSTE